MCKGNHNQTIETPNPLRPSNKVTILPDEVEKLTDIQALEYDRNLYQERARALSDKLKEFKAIVDGISDEIGWKSLLLKAIGK